MQILRNRLTSKGFEGLKTTGGEFSSQKFGSPKTRISNLFSTYSASMLGAGMDANSFGVLFIA
jgi:hypothetical protein